MFAPVGFLRFDEIFNFASNIARDICWAVRSKNVVEGIQIEQSVGERNAVECWLLNSFFENVTLYICSPNGVVLSSPAAMLRHIDQIDLMPCPVPIEDTTLEVQSSKEFEPSQAFQFSERFLFIHVSTGQIKTRKDILSVVPDKNGFSEDAQLFFKKQHIAMADALDAYAGWSLCAKEVDLPETDTELLEVFGVDEELLNKVNEDSALPISVEGTAKRGRPRKTDKVINAYWKLFPDGHEAAGLVFKQVHERIIAEIGTPFSADTLRRALGKKK